MPRTSSMSDKCTVPHFMCVLTYFKQTHLFFSVTYLITSNIGKKPTDYENHFEPGLNSPEPTLRSNVEESGHDMFRTPPQPSFSLFIVRLRVIAAKVEI